MVWTELQGVGQGTGGDSSYLVPMDAITCELEFEEKPELQHLMYSPEHWHEMLVQAGLFSEHHMDQTGHRLSILINTLLAPSFEQHWLIREILQGYFHKCN